MGRLKIFSGRQLCALLEQHGFGKVRQRGSHIVMQKRILAAYEARGTRCWKSTHATA